MKETMMAAVLHGAEDLRLESSQTPQLRPGMVLLRVRRAGICGSDLHYFQHGYCAAFVPTQPFILGHELTADVAAVADDVDSVKVGARVTVNPARTCGFCEYCRAGRSNLCRSTIMLGSASTKPPTNGAFAEFVAVRADQCHALPAEIDDGIGAMLEPFAVALHAVKRSGSVSAKRVLVVGGGPIGLLVAMTARMFGAAPVAVSDRVLARLDVARKLGAGFVLDPSAEDSAEIIRRVTGDGFDVVFEASGAKAAVRQAFEFVRPGGTIVQIGTIGNDDVPLPVNQLMTREIALLGSMRYCDVFDDAIRLVAAGRIDLRPLISGVFSLQKSAEAMQAATNKNQALKLQLEVA